MRDPARELVQCNIVSERGLSVKGLCYLQRFAPRSLCLVSRSLTPAVPAAAGAAPEPPAGATAYTISDLAREFALTTRAIRFYEHEGLLSPQRRGRVRIYGERERVRIKLILRGKRLGLALSEIRELFDIYALTRNEAAQLAKFLQMLADRRAMLQQQREDIDAVLAEIAALERDCRRRLAATGAPARRSRGAKSAS